MSLAYLHPVREPARLPPLNGKVPVRLLVLEAVAISVSLGTAVAAIGRLGLYMLLLWTIARGRSLAREVHMDHQGHWYPKWEWLCLTTIVYMACTIFWTSVDTHSGLWAWSDHARLLTVPAMFLMVHSRAEARTLLRYFVFTQLFVVLSSWLLIAEIVVPWAASEHALRDFEVFGTYLEQSISEAVTAFILWHQRSWIMGAQRKWLSILLSLTIVVHIIGFLPSRTGYLVTAALLCVTVLACVPRRWLIGSAVLASALTVLAFLTLPSVTDSESIRGQLAPLSQKLINPQNQRERQISTDVRLVSWAASLKAMAEKPLLGSGSGSWNREYLRSTSVDIPSYRNIRDPHQMFLLWGVEGGAIGLGLLCATLLAWFAKSTQFAQPDALSLQAILIALVVAGLTTSTIYGIGMGDFFCVGIGLLLSLGAAPNEVSIGESCDPV